MSFLRWLGSIVVFFWVLGLIFKFAGSFIHVLLVIAVIVFLADWLSGRSKKRKV